MLGFFQDFHQTFGEQALPPQAIQDLLKSLFIFFITPLLLLGLSCMIASRTGHFTSIQLSSGEQLIVVSNALSPSESNPDHYLGIDGQNPTVFCESVMPTKENNP